MTEENALTTSVGSVPAHIQRGGELEGLQGMDEHLVPPMVRVVQSNAQPPLTDLFSTGDVVLVPINSKIAGLREGSAEDGEPFFFTPIFFYVDYIQTSSWGMKGKVPFVLHQTTDPDSELARKAKDPALRTETSVIEGYEEHGEIEVRNVQCLNYVVLIEGELTETLPVMLSFSRSNHRAGQNLTTLIRARSANLYSGRYECRVKRVSNDQGTWFKMIVGNPSDGHPWCDEERQEICRKAFQQIQSKFVQADYDQVSDEDAIGSDKY